MKKVTLDVEVCIDLIENLARAENFSMYLKSSGTMSKEAHDKLNVEINQLSWKLNASVFMYIM